MDFELVGGPTPGLAITWAFHQGAIGPTDGRVYIIPHQAERVARFNPTSGVWESFGDTFPGGKQKWSRGAVSKFDNCIYSVPCLITKPPHSRSGVQKMLKIDPVEGTAHEFGEDLRKYAPGIVMPWLGVVAAADGCIFGMPCSARPVLRLDPRTGEISTFGQLEEKTSSLKYASGILGPSGRFIFGVPFNAPRVLCIDTEMLTVQLIGESYSGINKWSGGGIGGDGCLYCIPCNHKRVLRIDPVAMTTSLFGPDLHNPPLSWAGGAAGPYGCVYGTPHKSDYILKIDPFSRTVSKMDKAIPKEVRGSQLSGTAPTLTTHSNSHAHS